MSKKYVVRLTTEERTGLLALVKAGKAAAYRRTHAQILLKTDEGDNGPGWTDEETAQAYEVHSTTVKNVRERFVFRGLEGALNRKKQDRPSVLRKIDGEKDASELATEISAWEEARSSAEVTIKWQFTTDGARTKLHRLYPEIQPIHEGSPQP